jgi:hypothetical protein
MALEVERKEKNSDSLGIVAPVHFVMSQRWKEREKNLLSRHWHCSEQNTKSVYGKAKLQQHVNRYEM